MRKVLIQEDVKLVEDKIKTFESNTGCELLVVVTDAADAYPAASWRFGVISGFLIGLVFSYYFEFHHSLLWPIGFLALILFMTWIGHYSWAKKLALASWEVERECKEKALELFHTLGTSKVQHKVTAMIMVSILEKEIEVLVDEKLRTQISDTDLKNLISIMQKHFAEGHMSLGLIQSIQSLEDKILRDFGGKVSEATAGELKDCIHFIHLD